MPKENFEHASAEQPVVAATASSNAAPGIDIGTLETALADIANSRGSLIIGLE
jgi:hypothetical protein